MKKDKEVLLEWYNTHDEAGGEASGVPGAVIITKANIEREEPNIQQPNPCDLSPAPPESPQEIIQKNVIDQEVKRQLTTKTDNVIVQDKIRVYKAMGMLKALEGKLIHYSNLSGVSLDDPMKKEDFASEIKMLVNSLSEVVGSL